MASLTRSAIKAAMAKLLNERPLAHITVKDIVTECGINRNTFYYHYQGIPELIAEMVDDEAESIIQSHPTLETLEDCLETIIKTAISKKRAILHIYNSASRDTYEQYLWYVCDHVVGVYLDTILNGRQLPGDDRTLIQQHYTCFAFGCTSRWLDSGMKEEILPALRRIGQLQGGFAEGMIARSLGER